VAGCSIRFCSCLSPLELGGECEPDDRADRAVSLPCELDELIALPAIDVSADVDAILVLSKLTHLHFS
jgi:hypothetical protein